MSSIKCAQCGFVTWAGATNCKRCGAHLNSTHQSSKASTSEVVGAAGDARAQRNVHGAGWKKVKAGALFAGACVLVLIAAVGVNSTNSGYRISFKWISLSWLLPIALLLAGILQIVTGVPFEELSRRWDNLAGWQRGLIGVSVFLGGLLLLVIVCVVIFTVLDWRSGRPWF